MATTLKATLERVIGVLEDEDSVTWTLADLVRYLNDGQKDIHIRRPDLFNVEIDHPLVAGHRQTLPVLGSKLINIPYNTVGNLGAITPVSRPMLDAQLLNWRNARQVLEVVHFMYDERQPKVFEVYPPAKAGANVRLEYASIPADLPVPAAGTAISAITGEINVPDLQSMALQHYIVFRCYTEGSENFDAGKAQAFYQLYANDLGIEFKATLDVAPTPASN